MLARSGEDASTMKRRRTMLLCVTATSMAASAAACSGEPIGKIGRPDSDTYVDAGAPDAEASAPAATDAPPVVDTLPVGAIGKIAVDRDAGPPSNAHPPNAHPDRVGTTATVHDGGPPVPTVGTTARVPDQKK
jgi:hypothetical protein